MLVLSPVMVAFLGATVPGCVLIRLEADIRIGTPRRDGFRAASHTECVLASRHRWDAVSV